MNFLTRTRFLVIVIIIETILLVSIIATFGFRYYGYRQARSEFRENRVNGPDQPRDFMAKTLNLSPEQRNEFRALKSKFHQQFDTLESQSRNINNLLTEEIVKDNPDQKLIDSLIDRYSEIQRSQKRVMVSHLLEVRSTCNPEQQAKFNRFVCRMHEYQQNQNRRMQRMRRGQNPRNTNNQN